MKTIFITNDDGFESAGLRAAIDALKDMAKVVVVAPTIEKSACAHSLTLTRPLRFIKLEDDFYRLDDGTPTDCVYLSKNALFDEMYPDLIISGINKGANMGEDITYSGTAGGAMEGVLQGVPSIAISQVYNGSCEGMELFDFELAKETLRVIVRKIFEEGFPLGDRLFLNINVPFLPVSECKGFKVTHAGYRLYGNDAHLRRNPRGEEYYWIGLHPLAWGESRSKGSDFEAVSEGYVSITPIKLDMTSYEDKEKLRDWIG